MGELKEKNGLIELDVTVTNTGETAGKDVVELYFNPPYQNGGIEKATANLLQFAKQICCSLDSPRPLPFPLQRKIWRRSII